MFPNFGDTSQIVELKGTSMVCMLEEKIIRMVSVPASDISLRS